MQRQARQQALLCAVLQQTAQLRLLLRPSLRRQPQCRRIDGDMRRIVFGQLMQLAVIPNVAWFAIGRIGRCAGKHIEQ